MEQTQISQATFEKITKDGKGYSFIDQWGQTFVIIDGILLKATVKTPDVNDQNQTA
jgi:hypothetical protein